MPDLSSRLIQQFGSVAGAAAELELRVRLLCGIIPSIQHDSAAHKLEDVERAVVDYFVNELSAEERVTLERARQLRNKVLHADFHGARRKLQQIDGKESPSMVRVVKLQEGGELEQLRAIAESPKALGALVGATSSTQEGTVFGWLLEFGLSGEFQRAFEALEAATLIVERLRSLTEDPPG
jgi:hypothetical protein